MGFASLVPGAHGDEKAEGVEVFLFAGSGQIVGNPSVTLQTIRAASSCKVRVARNQISAGTACEFNQHFVRGEGRPARQRRTHAVGVEEDHVNGRSF